MSCKMSRTNVRVEMYKERSIGKANLVPEGVIQIFDFGNCSHERAQKKPVKSVVP